LLLPAAVEAQDGFGSAVAVAGPQTVVVLKPGAARGPSQARVFRWEEGAWVRDRALPLLAGGFPGETLTPTLTSDAAGRVVVLGAGDPSGELVGHLHLREGGEWRGAGRVLMDPAGGRPAGLPPSGLDMGTLMALMGPPPRSAVLDAEGRHMAVAGGALGEGAVRILARDGERWAVAAELEVPDGVSADGLGGSLAFDGARVLAGAPGMGVGGGGLLWSRGDGGRWEFVGTLGGDEEGATPDAVGTGALGSAVALTAAGAMLGDPDRDRVRTYHRDRAGGWVAGGLLSPTVGGEDSAGTSGAVPAGPDLRTIGFGASLAADGEILAVGAPRAGDRRGAVHLFRSAGDDGWTAAGVVAPAGLEPGDGFGASVALAHGRLVVGAPGAYGDQGRAAVFDLADLEAGPTWLDAGEPLERVVGAPVPCAEGVAEGFDCSAVDLVSFLPLSAMGADPGERVSDIWGWTDPITGREYLLAGRTAGMAVLDLTDAANPVFVGLMPGNPSSARDIKVYRDHAFMTGDGAGEHGLLVFDLTRIREVASYDMPVTFEADARYDLVASAHNLIIDVESGFAYTVGTNTGGESCGGGLHMIDIRDPLNPAFAGCYTDSAGLIWSGRTHDAQCTVYRGPDEAYRGRQICFASNETAMRVVDVTDKENPVPISAMSHPGTAYVHQGWLTEDQRYLYVNDELDEIVGTTDRTRTLVWDVTELDDPVLVAEHLGPDQATDHNLFIKGDRAYLANYQAGFRILDISEPEAPVEIGWFDTTPYGPNPPGFGGGAWTAFPFFDSGMVAVSSINEGIFVLRPRSIVP
jgi:choice-of-anchor B domain-containing protein